jgi:hypothetical protein
MRVATVLRVRSGRNSHFFLQVESRSIYIESFSIGCWYFALPKLGIH